jgi:hypothetical protein
VKRLLIPAYAGLLLFALTQAANAQEVCHWDPKLRHQVCERFKPRPPWHPSQPQFEPPDSPTNRCAGSYDPDCYFREKYLRPRRR